jgi:hypothetical protein
VIEELQEENRRLREALEIYADSSSWTEAEVGWWGKRWIWDGEADYPAAPAQDLLYPMPAEILARVKKQIDKDPEFIHQSLNEYAYHYTPQPPDCIRWRGLSLWEIWREGNTGKLEEVLRYLETRRPAPRSR